MSSGEFFKKRIIVVVVVVVVIVVIFIIFVSNETVYHKKLQITLKIARRGSKKRA
jgi:type II secretory pathway component PulF